MRIRIAVEGEQRLMRKLEGLPVKVQKKVSRQALRDGAKIMRTAIREKMPVRSGRMRRALTVRTQRRKRGEVGLNVTFDTKRYPGLVTRTKGGKRFFYPAVLEYGAPASGRPAQPFMRPGFDESAERAKATVLEKLRAGIEREARAGP